MDTSWKMVNPRTKSAKCKANNALECLSKVNKSKVNNA